MISHIAAAINFLGKGVSVKKLCFHKYKIEPVVLHFSEDFKFVAIFICDNHKMQVCSLSQFLYADSGFRTTRLLQYRKAGY